VVVVTNVLGVTIYKAGQRRSHRQEASAESEILSTPKPSDLETPTR
jgi:hypothetical protein